MTRLFLFAFLLLGAVSNSYAACAGPVGVIGQFIWSSANSDMRVCNGTTWLTSKVTVLGGTCSTAGAIAHQSSDLQFCDGAHWVSMTGASDGSCAGFADGYFQWNASRGWMRWCQVSTWKVMRPGSDITPIGSNTAAYNVFTAAGSPASAGVYAVTINAGVNITSGSPGTPALQTGAFPANSGVIIVNNGNIIGAGGAGSAGAGNSNASAGGVGGNAISLTVTAEIDNTNGNIFGGGGGGGGGASDNNTAGCGKGCTVYVSGGGGGGGAGNSGGAAGGAGAVTTGTTNVNGAAGTAGTTTGGAGGAGGSSTGCVGGAGGAGGAYGAAGSSGAAGVGANCSAYKAVGAGGAGGNAVKQNGNTLVFTLGNNATQVKGGVN